nr:MAG TPA: hypothetical protein [Caudoviricetes sp.]
MLNEGSYSNTRIEVGACDLSHDYIYIVFATYNNLILLLRLDYIINLLNKGYFPLRAAWPYSLSR